MQPDDIYPRLGEIFAEVFDRNDLVLAPTVTARDIEGWDSFKQIEIIVAVEQRFGIRATTRDLDGLQCVGDLVALIGRRTTEA